MTQKVDPVLPLPAQSKRKIRVRALLSHCLYRRVILWLFTVVVLISLVMCTNGVPTPRNGLLDLVHFHKNQEQGSQQEQQQPQQSNDKPAEKSDEEKKKDGPHWLQYTQ